MKMTLLDMTQSILSSLGSDSVNSIGDTVESNQVAEILRTTYYNLLGRYDLPEHNRILQLTSSGSILQPTLMFRPDQVHRIEWVKYFDSNPSDTTSQYDQYGAYSHDLNLDLQNNGGGAWSTISTTSNTIVSSGTVTFTVPASLGINPGDAATAYNGVNSMSGTVFSYSGTTLVITVTSATGSGTFTSWAIVNSGSLPVGPGYKEVHQLTVDEFLRMTNSFDPTEPDVGSYQLGVYESNSQTTQNFTVYYKNSAQPSYYCVLANYYVLFDSYDSTQDTTLQSSKTEAMAWLIPEWEMSDTFIPYLDDQQFPLFLADAKLLAFEELKQMPHKQAELEVSRQLVSLQKWKAISGKLNYYEEFPNFGRSGGGWY